jgi:hypothetical protein
MRLKGYVLGLALVAVAASAYGDVIPIADAKRDTTGCTLINEGKQVTVTGLVTVENAIFSRTNLDLYIQDHTGGLNIYQTNAAYYRLRLGDSVIVTGRIDQVGAAPYRGNTRLSVESLQDISILGKGALPRPTTITAAELNRSCEPPMEPYEGLLVRLADVSFNPADWPSAGVDKVITAQTPRGSFKIRIARDTNIGGSAVPLQPLILIGVVIQDGAYPYLSGYTVWPRSRQTDFLVMGSGSGIAEVAPPVVGIGTTSFDLNVTLDGNLSDTIRAFSVDLPLSDGWSWSGGGVDLSGPGLADATYEVTPTGVIVRSAAVFDDLASYSVVTLRRVSAPASIVSSRVVLKTSVDGTTFSDIAYQPSLGTVRPKPSVVINEVFPNDGRTAASDAFIELCNKGTTTAYLQGLVLCEVRSVPYCDIEVRHAFAAKDTIPGGGYLVVAETSEGFTARFGSVPFIQAAISPLGRVSGDGGICGDGQTYEAISLWRDASLTEMVDYVEYRDGIACTADLCEGFGTDDDALPWVPPRGYAIISKVWSPCCPWEALSADPSPGTENRVSYSNPTIRSVSSKSQNILEVSFSEPIDTAAKSNFHISRGEAIAVYPSLSREKALLLFDDLPLGAGVGLEVTGLMSLAGNSGHDTVFSFTTTLSPSTKPCDIQAYDANGLSLYNGKSVTMFGFMTVPPGVFQPSYQSIYVQGLDGCGINVFSYARSSPAPRIGDFVSVSGAVTEYISAKAGATTEISMAGPEGLRIDSRGYPEPVALVLSTGAVGREENEGRLVETEGAVVSASEYSFYISDGSGGVQVYQNYTPIDFTRFRTGMYARVKGVILQYDFTMPFLEGYELVPRYDSDIEIITDAFPKKPTLGVDARVFCPSCGEDGFPIRFGAPASSDVTIRIFDAAGRLVSTLYNGASVGERSIAWTGRDALGKPLPPGLYVCHIKVVESVTGTTSTESAPIVIGTQLK